MDRMLAVVAAAYEGLEAPNSFPDGAARESYRARLLENSRVQADLLAGALRADARVLEVACGSGRLLIELAQRRAIAFGHGVDIAESRIAFAREWAEELGLDELRFKSADALTLEAQPASFDAAVCITGALGYFAAASPRCDGQLLDALARSLRPGGLLCLELYPHPRERRMLEAAGGEANLWKELPPGDPWRFYLSRLSLRSGILSHEKTFVHRHDGRVDTGRREALYLYTRDELPELLAAAGFEEFDLRAGWSRELYEGGELLVVLARRAA